VARTLKSVEPALGVREHLASAMEPFTLTTPSKHFRLSKATMHRVLLTLRDRGYVVRDPITAREIEDLIRKLQEERHVTSLVVTHDIRGAGHYADRMAFVDRGTIAAVGTLDELRQSRHPFVSEFLREAL